LTKAVVAVVIAVVVVLAAIGIALYTRFGGGTPSPTTPATPATIKKPVKVLVLFDVGGRGDLSFNDMAWLGAERTAKEFGVQVSFMTPRSLGDMEPLLKQLSASKEYELIVLVGFLWTDPLNKTADLYPEQKYALIDATTGVVRPNEVDILFREQEVAALVGVLASGMAKSLGFNTVGAVAGMDIPPLWRFHIGYLFGVKYFEKKSGVPMKFLWQYTGTFTDPSVGYNTAWQLLQQGAAVLYGLAGYTHVGMFNAVIDWNERGLWKGVCNRSRC
jgi:basic membrane protein A